MAKISPKGKKVTGTKKKDKITWVSSKAWKKALTVNAGKGNDIINFKKSKYKNTLNGQDGNDVIYGGTKADKINGGNGNDKLYGYGGNDKIYGGNGEDKIWGGKGNDYINAGKGINTIYHNTGDGDDTIVSGSGDDSIVFNFAGGNDLGLLKLNASISRTNSNDLIITRTDGGSVTLKDYMKGGHSVNYIHTGPDVVRIEEIKHHIIGRSETIYDTDWGDEIYLGSENLGDIDEVTVNTDRGHDIIVVATDKQLNINLGQGNDTISVTEPFVNMNIFFNNGDGNNSLIGLADRLPLGMLHPVNTIALCSPDLFNNISFGEGLNFGYIKYYLQGTGEPGSTTELVLQLTGGETFTIGGFDEIAREIVSSIIAVNRIGNREIAMPLTYCMFNEDSIYTLDANDNADYTSEGEGSLIISQRNTNTNSKHIIINDDSNTLIQQGYGNQQANINADNCRVVVKNDGNTTNDKITVSVNGENNMVNLIGGDYQFIDMYAGEEHNQIILSGANSVNATTSDLGITYIQVDGAEGSDNIITSNGNDTIELGDKGSYSVSLVPGSPSREEDLSKSLILGSGYNKIRIPNTNINNLKEIEIEQAVNGYAKDIMFTHYNTVEHTHGQEDYISILIQKEDGTFYDTDSVNTEIYAYWINNQGNAEFNIDNANAANKISITTYGREDDITKKLSEMTQYVDMQTANNSLTVTSEGGVLNVAKEVYVQGTTSNDTYTCNTTTMGKQVVINETGGNDTLNITETAKAESFRFFFDVDKTGNILGTDLYIMSMANGEGDAYYTGSSLYQFIAGKDMSVDYLKIENFFDGNGGHGTGFIETITGSDNKTCNIDACINAIKADVVTWLAASHGGVYFDSVMQAISENGNTNTLVGIYTTEFSPSDVEWNNYWT